VKSNELGQLRRSGFPREDTLRIRRTDVRPIDSRRANQHAVVLWNTVYISAALEQLRAEGHRFTDEDMVHLSPARFEHINPYGRYHFDPELANGELSVTCDPWCEMWIDGKKRASTVFKRFTLTVGVHTVRLVNPDSKAEMTKKVTITAEELAPSRRPRVALFVEPDQVRWFSPVCYRNPELENDVERMLVLAGDATELPVQWCPRASVGPAEHGERAAVEWMRLARYRHAFGETVKVVVMGSMSCVPSTR
jgi:hypothetical protein